VAYFLGHPVEILNDDDDDVQTLSTFVHQSRYARECERRQQQQDTQK